MSLNGANNRMYNMAALRHIHLHKSAQPASLAFVFKFSFPIGIHFSHLFLHIYPSALAISPQLETFVT